jgi:adenine C2-methylase RlmN of 23S rRNA A2503 and tRNA A37/CheY-like chemotaxis protein
VVRLLSYKWERNPEILIVDDEELILRNFEEEFASRKTKSIVSSALTAEAADREMLKGHKDVALIDVHLAGGVSGIDLALKWQKLYPETLIIMMSGYPGKFLQEPEKVVDFPCLEKTDTSSVVFMVYHLLDLATSPEEVRQVIKKISRQLPYKGKFNVVRGEFDKYEDLIGEVILRDGSRERFKFVNYFWRRYNPKAVKIGLTPAIGCSGRCRMCLEKDKPLKYLFSKEQIGAQFVHSLDSYQTSGIFTGQRKVVANFTCMSDFRHNFRNCWEAMREIYAVKELNTSFIVTTVGSEESLEWYLEHASELPVQLYLSGNCANQDKRDWLMPGSKNESLARLVNIGHQIAEKTNQLFTYCYIVIKGFNDKEEDIDQLENLLGGKLVKIKVMPLEPGSLKEEGIKDISWREAGGFVRRVRARSFVRRVDLKAILGRETNSNCGGAIVPDDWG